MIRSWENGGVQIQGVTHVAGNVQWTARPAQPCLLSPPAPNLEIFQEKNHLCHFLLFRCFTYIFIYWTIFYSNSAWFPDILCYGCHMKTILIFLNHQELTTEQMMDLGLSGFSKGKKWKISERYKDEIEIHPHLWNSFDPVSGEFLIQGLSKYIGAGMIRKTVSAQSIKMRA